MIQEFSERWADFLVQNGAPEEERDVYRYGLECLLGELTGDVLLMACALFFHKSWQMFLWILAYTPLRVHLGGFHNSNQLLCLINSTILGVACVLIYPFLMGRFLLSGAVVLISLCIIYFVAPVTHKNRPVSAQRLRFARKVSIVIGILEGIIILGTFYILPEFSAVVGISLFSVTVLALIGKLVGHKDSD